MSDRLPTGPILAAAAGLLVVVAWSVLLSTPRVAGPGDGPAASAWRPAFLPPPRPGRSLHLAPIGEFDQSEIDALVRHYRASYGLEVKVASPVPLVPAVRDAARGQLIGEDLIALLREGNPELAADPDAVIIGLVEDDLYIRDRPDWAWAFGLREEGRIAVVSTARMHWALIGSASRQTVATRLRKMVTRYVGFLYYELPPSDDPRSVLRRELGGVEDLDGMTEEF